METLIIILLALGAGNWLIRGIDIAYKVIRFILIKPQDQEFDINEANAINELKYMDRTKLGLSINLIDPDDDYLGIEIRAWNDRYMGTTFIYAGYEQLSEFASYISGFPSKIPDERIYEFGTRDPHYAGGYCRLRFYTIGGSGYALIDIDIEEEDFHKCYPNSTARLTISVKAADIDRFVPKLRAVEAARSGEAVLEILD
ncbi:MAG: hypothetical protein ACYC27_14340 [Armatimonadota bacterium]